VRKNKQRWKQKRGKEERIAVGTLKELGFEIPVEREGKKLSPGERRRLAVKIVQELLSPSTNH
jgi:hypothetical protein